MAWLVTGGNAGALMPVSDTGYGRPALGHRLRSTWNLRAWRPRIAGAKRQNGRSVFRPAIGGAVVSSDAATQSGSSVDVLALRWLRGLVPAEIDQRVTLSFDSWHNAQTKTEIVTGVDGVMTVANLLAVRAAWRIVQSGHSVVVQVWSMPERPSASGATIRVWVCNGDSARAVEAKILEQNLQLDEGEPAQTTQTTTTRFATGWIVTGEPGGAHRSQ
ncbi:hypothetical protein E3T39_07610 [Cryobacterium suzukii]|uniref:Uncharacterized protein n=1 Tax=Cryobacterium suzukii TaxID=1259198 RepID=A0A4R9AGD1_9MICO|nr:hypothetical protein [Cryobacterium suzukii]TFD60963.1 hypothetical protein E3T39_07610 [Cryobacterium suzukii]